MLAGSSAARRYGYSSARVKAMESRLISRKEMQEIIDAKDISTIISMLFQGDYKSELEEYGGLEIKSELIDFALSKNLAKSVAKLVQISPSTERKLMRAVVGKWDLYNIKIGIEAKERGSSFESIERYIIDYGRYDSAAIREAMRDESVEGMLAKLMINSPYRDILAGALEEYKRSKSSQAAVAAIDRSYYNMLSSVIIGLRIIDNNSARIVKMDIDMKNILLMLKAKRSGMKFADITASIVPGGNIGQRELEDLYSNSKDIESLVSQLKEYDLKPALDAYKSGGGRRLLPFEIGLRNNIFRKSTGLLNHSILSFGAMMAYAYMKEIEILTLRILINSKLYGLGKDETASLMIWKE